MEECSQPVVSSDELVLFVKQWHPSTLTLGPFQEIALESKVSMICLNEKNVTTYFFFRER